nr:hypothetical protein [Tanacetum cinerariifolium]
MLTKPQFFYDHTTKQALGFQNPFDLKKAQQLEPKLYDGNVIEKTSSIVIHDSEETLMLVEESRSKMLLKQKDPMMVEKKVNTTPVDYSVLNQLSQHFETRFVPQNKLSTEQAFWSQDSVNSLKPTLSSRPTNVEVPKEHPKVSMVNTSLKKLKHHLASFDVVVKEKTTATAIIEGTWGFKHTKACFRDEIILFVKALKDLFNSFDQYLVDELSEVQNDFHKMKQAIEQHRVGSKTFEVKMNKVLNKNEQHLEQVISKDIVNIILNSSVDDAYENMHECEKCLQLETELLNRKDFIKKETYDKLFRKKDMVISKLKERIKSLSGQMKEDKIKMYLEEIETINIKLDHRVSKLVAENEHLKQAYKQLYDSIKSTRIQSKEQCDDLINQFNLKSVEISDLNASLQEKGLVITALKDALRKLKGKALADDVVTSHSISPEMLTVDVEPLNLRLLNNRITTTVKVPLRKPITLESDTPKHVEKGLIIAALKDELRKLKGKSLVDNVVTTHTIALEMLKIDVEPIAPRLLNNRTSHSDYLKLTQEQAVILKEVVKQGKSQNPLNNSLDSACKYTK